MGSLFSSFSLFADIFPQTLIHGLEIFIKNVKPDHLNFFFIFFVKVWRCIKLNTLHFILFIAEMNVQILCNLNYTKDDITFMDFSSFFFYFTVPGVSSSN